MICVLKCMVKVMKIFKLTYILIVIVINTVVIVKQHEKISEQENKLLLQQMEIHMLKTQVILMSQSNMMNSLNFYNKSIASKMQK